MLGIYNKENVSTGATKDMYEKALRSFTHNSPTWNNTLTSITVRRDVCIVVCWLEEMCALWYVPTPKILHSNENKRTRKTCSDPTNRMVSQKKGNPQRKHMV